MESSDHRICQESYLRSTQSVCIQISWSKSCKLRSQPSPELREEEYLSWYFSQLNIVSLLFSSVLVPRPSPYHWQVRHCVIPWTARLELYNISLFPEIPTHQLPPATYSSRQVTNLMFLKHKIRRRMINSFQTCLEFLSLPSEIDLEMVGVS